MAIAQRIFSFRHILHDPWENVVCHLTVCIYVVMEHCMYTCITQINSKVHTYMANYNTVDTHMQ